MNDADRPAGRGLGYGLLAYFVWGFFPAYFKAVASVPALQVVAHRIVWSALFLLLVIALRRSWQGVRAVLHDPPAVLILAISALLIGTNWLVFVLAVEHGQILQSSLGYFITPLVSIVLGYLFLQERLRRLQLVSVGLAVLGVIILTVQHGRFPWVALTLAVTFGSYGLLRKVVRADPLVCLTVETVLLAPLALGYLFLASWHGEGAFLHQGGLIDLLLPLAGVVTAVPLLLFAAAARSLRLATIGFLQYITPTMHFLLAVFAYGETFTSAHLVSFLLIWAGLGCYSWDAFRNMALPRRS